MQEQRAETRKDRNNYLRQFLRGARVDEAEGQRVQEGIFLRAHAIRAQHNSPKYPLMSIQR